MSEDDDGVSTCSVDTSNLLTLELCMSGTVIRLVLIVLGDYGTILKEYYALRANCKRAKDFGTTPSHNYERIL